ncbi:MAG: LysE family transporter [Thaumarchaeota archaeon]|nr:LysE family transporter [Nitrososphaerota archaeon]
MEELVQFFLMVVLISASGALAPGPLLVATMNVSLKAGRYAGFMAAFGHMVFELPLVIAISFGIWGFINDPTVSFSIGLIGAIALILFGLLQARSSLKSISAGGEVSKEDPQARLVFRKGGLSAAFLVGLLFTGLNPYFLTWWFTVGLTLISEAIKIGAIMGVFLMFIFHIWLDYAWLGAAGYATATGASFLKPRQISILSLALALAVAVFGVLLLLHTFGLV